MDNYHIHKGTNYTRHHHDHINNTRQQHRPKTEIINTLVEFTTIGTNGM